MSRSILVVAAHPDDEALGCGGTMGRSACVGARVRPAFLADGVSSRGRTLRPRDPRKLAARRAAAEKACALLGASAEFFGDFPDNRLDTVPLLSLAQCVEALIAKHRPEMLLTHHGGDLNIDHRLVHQAVATACRPQPGLRRSERCSRSRCPRARSGSLHGSGQAFAPNWFVDISGTLDKKLAALDAYAVEMRGMARMHVRAKPSSTWRGGAAQLSACRRRKRLCWDDRYHNDRLSRRCLESSRDRPRDGAASRSPKQSRREADGHASSADCTMATWPA